MRVGEKIRYLREVEGSLRGLGRPITQQEMIKAIHHELRKSISQSYLSQIESGARPHMTQSSRALLARFFKVHPGFLVDDPDGYHTELTSDLRATEDRLDLWLITGAEQFAEDPELSHALLQTANLRFLLVRGRGKHFSAGADLAWMQQSAELDYHTNLDDARELAELMYNLAKLKIPTVAVVQGAAFGGALGLISCCDMAIGADDAQFLSAGHPGPGRAARWLRAGP